QRLDPGEEVVWPDNILHTIVPQRARQSQTIGQWAMVERAGGEADAHAHRIRSSTGARQAWTSKDARVETSWRMRDSGVSLRSNAWKKLNDESASGGAALYSLRCRAKYAAGLAKEPSP